MYDPKSQLKELIMKKEYLIYAGLILLGAILAPQIRKIPVIGPKLPA